MNMEQDYTDCDADPLDLVRFVNCQTELRPSYSIRRPETGRLPEPRCFCLCNNVNQQLGVLA